MLPGARALRAAGLLRPPGAAARRAHRGPGQRPAGRGVAVPAGPDLRHFLRAAAAGQPGPSPELPPQSGSAPGAPKVYLETYGCQMNVNDTEIAWTILQKNGYARTKELDEADVVLLVTCSVREKAEQAIWNRLQHLKTLKARRPQARAPLRIGILGCMAERLKEEILHREKLVDVVAGPDAYRDLPRLLAVAESGQQAANVLLSLDETYADILPVQTSAGGRTAFVDIKVVWTGRAQHSTALREARMGVQRLVVACGAVALCLALTTATNPGFVVRITQAGLDYAHQQGIVILEKELAQLKLPDISGDSRVGRVGKVRYELSRLRLRDFHLPYSRITPISNVGLQVSISNAFAELDGDWRVKFLFVRDHGSFNLKVENVYIKISLRLGSDASGKPTVSTSECSTRISKVRVLFSGRLGWLYNLFHRAIESRFRKILEDKICGIVDKSVQNELQKYVQTLPVTARIDAKTGIDYSLVAPPRATAQSLDADLKGEFYSLAHRSTVPFSPLPLAFPSDHDRMVYFGASSYFFNTAGIAYHEAGALVFEITENMIPKDAGFSLDTSIFSAFIPQLEEMYPNMPMKFRLSTPTAPFLTIGPGGISLKPIVDAQAYAILPNSSLAPLFLLSLTGNVSAVINVRSGRIVGSLDVGRIRLSLKDSAVGTFEVRTMQSLMNFLTSRILLPRLNARLDEGFPLPLLDRIQLSNILVRFYQNFLLLGADVHFQPRG